MDKRFIIIKRYNTAISRVGCAPSFSAHTRTMPNLAYSNIGVQKIIFVLQPLSYLAEK